MIKDKLLLCLLFFCFSPLFSQHIPSKEVQIKTALLAAPKPMGDSATVYGYNPEGDLERLQSGSSKIICLADDPKNDGFSVSCYHKDLAPFMARGRELKALGKTHQEVFEVREEEVKSGKLKMPVNGTTLFIYYASQEDYDTTSGEVRNGSFRYVVYIPYATAETTGLPLSPASPGMPWLMDPGTHRAHIMITPPVK